MDNLELLIGHASYPEPVRSGSQAGSVPGGRAAGTRVPQPHRLGGQRRGRDRRRRQRTHNHAARPHGHRFRRHPRAAGGRSSVRSRRLRCQGASGLVHRRGVSLQGPWAGGSRRRRRGGGRDIERRSSDRQHLHARLRHHRRAQLMGPRHSWLQGKTARALHRISRNRAHGARSAERERGGGGLLASGDGSHREGERKPSAGSL